MKIPTALLAIAFGALVGLQGWTLSEIVNLKTEMATLRVTMAAHLASK